jgi:hypothetical protein
MQHWNLSRLCCSRLNWILIIYFIFFPRLFQYLYFFNLLCFEKIRINL